MNRATIDEFEAGPAKVAAAVRGLTPEELTARPGPGEWSIHENVIHILDSDAIAIDRMKRMICEDNPTQLYADESAYVQRLYSHEQSLDDALVLLEVGRRQFARVLRKLPDSAFAREATHNRSGRVTLEEMVQSYIDHIDAHLKFVTAKRERLQS